MATLGESLAQGFSIGSGIANRRYQREQDTLNNVFREKQFDAIERERGINNRFQQLQLELQQGAAKRDEQRLGIQKRQEELELKKIDYTTKSSLLELAQTTDPAILNAKADLFLKTFGGDPKSEQSKAFKKLLTSINDDTRANFINVLESVGPNLPPGTVANFAKAIATGRVDIGTAITQIENIGRKAASKGGVSSREMLNETGDIAGATALQNFEANEVGIDQQKAVTESLRRFGQTTNSALVSAVDKTSQRLGIDLGARIRSARRDEEHNRRVGGAAHSQHLPGKDGKGNAFDIDTKGLTKDQKIAIIDELSAQGITGFGIGKNTIHADKGRRRVWGYDDNGRPNGPIPDWAKDSIKEHMSRKSDPTLDALEMRLGQLEELATVGMGTKVGDDARAMITAIMNSPNGKRLQEQIKTREEVESAGPVAEAKAVGEAEGARKAPLSPAIVSLFGASPSTRMSEDDAAEKGWFVPPKDVQVELRKQELALAKTLRSTEKLVKMVENRPEVVGTAGGFASVINSISSEVKGFAKLIPGLNDYIPEGAEDVASSIIEEAGITNAQVKSEIINLVFLAAGLSGQSGHGVSNKDIENFTRQIVAGGHSPKAMVGVLRAFALSQSSAVRESFKIHTGADRNFGVPDTFIDLDNDALIGVESMAKLLTSDQLDALEAEFDKRIEAASRKAR